MRGLKSQQREPRVWNGRAQMFGLTVRHRTAPMSLSHGTPNLPWVVLVEDDESLQHQLADALERALPEVEVQRTPDPEEALAWARDTRARLLITEQQSLYVDGLTLAACV